MKHSALSEAELRDNSPALVKLIVETCLEVKASDPTVLKVNELSDIADYFIVVSGRSDRQVQGIANKVSEELAKHGIKPGSVEGYDRAHWVLMDFGDILLHIFYEPVREHYDIEGLWARAERVTF